MSPRPHAASSSFPPAELDEPVVRGTYVCVVSMPGVHSRSKLGHEEMVKVVV